MPRYALVATRICEGAGCAVALGNIIRKQTETINDTSVRVQAVPVDDNPALSLGITVPRSALLSDDSRWNTCSATASRASG